MNKVIVSNTFMNNLSEKDKKKFIDIIEKNGWVERDHARFSSFPFDMSVKSEITILNGDDYKKLEETLNEIDTLKSLKDKINELEKDSRDLAQLKSSLKILKGEE